MKDHPLPLRTLLIRIMLVALGATAVVGAAAALLSNSTAGWRLVGTGITTAVAAGLMLPFSILADKPAARREGLLGMALVVVEFAGVLGMIWGVFRSIGGWDLDEKAGLTLLFLGLTALPAILFLRFASTPSVRLAGWAGIALCAIVFLLFMIAVWIPSSMRKSDWYETAGAVAAIGLLGAGSLAGIGAGTRGIWRWVGVLASLLGIAMAIAGIWTNPSSGAWIFAIVISVAAVIAHASVCLLVPLTMGQKWIRIVTIAAAIATAALCDLMVYLDEFHSEVGMAGNICAAAGIIACCGTLTLLVLARINRNLDRVPVLSEIQQLTVICPGCLKKQTLRVGDSACAGCGLKFSIRLEEPRCPKCDYLLFMLQSGRCPECGTMIGEAVMPA